MTSPTAPSAPQVLPPCVVRSNTYQKDCVTSPAAPSALKVLPPGVVASHSLQKHCVTSPAVHSALQVLPPGVVASNTRPLPVPVELFQLNSLSDILNLDTWANELDESDRASLRALLPNKVREAAQLWVNLWVRGNQERVSGIRK